MRLTSSIRLRLILWYVAILALILCLCSGAIYVTEQQSLLAQADSHLVERLHQWAGAYDARSGRLTLSRDPDIASGTDVVLLLSPAGSVFQTLAMGQLSAVKTPWPHALRALQAVARGGAANVVEQGLTLTTVTTSKDGLPSVTTAYSSLYRLTGMPLIVRRHVVALLVVGIRSDVSRQMDTLARTLQIIVPLTLLLCAGGGLWLADRALRPIQTITQTARHIGATDLSKRLNLLGHDEVGQLAATIDGMLERLEAAFVRQRQFTDDAGHELRTPLAIVDLEAAHALVQPRTPEEYRRAITVIQQEAAHMSRLVDDLLILARADSEPIMLQPDGVDLGEVMLDIVERLSPLARQSAMTLVIEGLPERPVVGNRDALTRMLMNIVENALKYGAGHGTLVHVTGGLRYHAGIAGVWLQVADNGPGIAAEHLPHLFERFYRVDPARTHVLDTTPRNVTARLSSAAHLHRVQPESLDTPSRDVPARPSGSGLGLAISHSIIAGHGGTLHIQSPDGHGVLVDIWLPASAT